MIRDKSAGRTDSRHGHQGEHHALDAIDGLIKTGPTGTNVNDISIALPG